MEKKASIALCTYNGARYLDAQLASLVCQTRLPDELVVCDDISTDDTVAKLERFAETAPFPIHITINERRLGPAGNFGKAAALCGGDIVLFCDQDDIWHDDKVALQVEAMVEAEQKLGAAVPILIHGDLEVVDENLALLHKSFMGLMHPYRDRFNISYMLGDNIAVGLTTAVNRALLDLALPLPEQALMHDWWFAQCATACGRVIYIDRSLGKYRQHAGNQIGASSWMNRATRKLSTPRQQWARSLDSLRATVAQAGALQDRLAERGNKTVRGRQAISDYASLLSVDAATRIRRAFRHGYGRSGRLGILWFLLKAIFA